MILTVRLPRHVEQKLTLYCAQNGISKADAVRGALERLLYGAVVQSLADHPFVGADRGDGSDVSGNIKIMLRMRLNEHRAR